MLLSTVVYLGIGNSDDKLSQARWRAFCQDMRALALSRTDELLTELFTPPDHYHQSAQFIVRVTPEQEPIVRQDLAALARRYGQDAIAWNVQSNTEFIQPDYR